MLLPIPSKKSKEAAASSLLLGPAHGKRSLLMDAKSFF